MQTNLKDAHVYLFRHWILDLLCEYKQISDVKTELLPLLTKLQFSRTHGPGALLLLYYLSERSRSNCRPSAINRLAEISQDENCFDVEKFSTTFPRPDRQRGNFSCYAYVLNYGFCGRASTLVSYGELNRQVARGQLQDYLATRPSVAISLTPEAAAVLKTQVGPDSLLGDSVKIQEKASIKKSIIAQHCSIGKAARIINSILMDHVSIEDK